MTEEEQLALLEQIETDGGFVAPEVENETPEEAAARKRLQLELAIDDELQARADPDALQQVLVNLIDNAVKYTPEDGSVRITANEGDSAERGRCVRLEVGDDGPGVPPKHRDRLFERFYRVDKGRSRQMGGTGLGLSIVKNLVDSMDGQVGYSPAEPRGSIFWVELPRAS